jgi:hypothetical protein
VQCLFHLPHFNDYFLQEKYLAERNGKHKNVVGLYKDLYINVMRKNSQDSVSTLPLKRSVCILASIQPPSAAYSWTGNKKTRTNS